VNTTVVARCQVAPTLGNPAANRERAAHVISHAAAQGASVVVLPELVSSGYVYESQAEAKTSAETADGATVTLWTRLAADHQLVIIGGFCELAGGELFNSVALVDPDGLRCVYRKAHLWDKERLWFSPGSAAPPVIPTLSGQIAVMICYDLEFPEWVRLPALDGAQLLCAPVNWPAFPRPAGEQPAEIVRVQADAAVNRMFIAACDRTGAERGADWVGGSVIVDADGWPLTDATPAAGPATIIAECRLDDALDKNISPISNVHADRRPELYRRITENTTPPTRAPGPVHASPPAPAENPAAPAATGQAPWVQLDHQAPAAARSWTTHGDN
jgi:predicted amidohydrolase